jgi:hypothetical protein
MSVNPDGMRGGMGIAEEFVDLEHQVIRQKVNATAAEPVVEVTPGDNGAEFDPGERQLDREEVAQLVYYRRYATINFLQTAFQSGASEIDRFAIVDASVGINGDLFREVTTQQSFGIAGQPDVDFTVDTGGEIGLLDNYQLYAQPQYAEAGAGAGAGGLHSIEEFAIPFYDWPTGGPIVDSFDTITCGFAFGADPGKDLDESEVQLELRYDFWWDVAEQGRSTNPFGRPSTR